MTTETPASEAQQPSRVGSPPRTREALTRLLARVLGRSPGVRLVDAWADRLAQSATPAQFVEALMNSKMAKDVRAVSTVYEAGHFFSPVVDPETVRDYVKESRHAAQSATPAGVEFPLAEMEDFWRRNQETIATTPFPERPSASHRYSFTGGPYEQGDGTTLRAMIADRRPKTIIEIGSGFSSACMLDTIDELGLDTKLVCIEPYPGRLLSLMRDGDDKTVSIIAEGVQGQNLRQFADLEPNDILFIDSSHVLKTGSDVHYELFYILPVLKPGVVIHFHDCRYPFEYPDGLIFKKNRSWNEAYAVRALLMNSTRYRVIFSGSFFAQHREEMIRQTFPAFLQNAGSALWLEALDDGRPCGLDAVGGFAGFDARTVFRPDEAPLVRSADPAPAKDPQD